jgi:hypothetical protein
MATQQQAIKNAVKLVESENQIPADVKQRITQELRSVPSPLEWDPWIYRLVVLFLGSTVLCTVIGGLYLAGSSGADISPGLIALGSAAVGALAGLLAPSPAPVAKQE